MLQAHSLFASLSLWPHHLFSLAKIIETKSAYWLLLGYSIGTTVGGIIFQGCPSVVLGMELKALCVSRGASSAGSGLITVPPVSSERPCLKKVNGFWRMNIQGLWPPHVFAHILTECPKYVYLHLHTHDHRNIPARKSGTEQLLEETRGVSMLWANGHPNHSGDSTKASTGSADVRGLRRRSKASWMVPLYTAPSRLHSACKRDSEEIGLSKEQRPGRGYL